MRKRLLTALVGISISFGLLALGREGFAVLWAIVGFLLVAEWQRGEGMPWPFRVGFYPVVGALWLAGIYPDFLSIAVGLLLGGLALALFWIDPQRDFSWIYRVGWGLVFLGIGWGSVLWLFFHSYSFSRIVAFLSLVWVSDTAAYFVGKFWGRWKILPRVSPNKTWEGFIGGVVATMVWGYWAIPWAGGWTGLPPIVGGAVVAVLAFLGDAWQSAWKRSRNLKDSGALLPGHGGIWDRVDSLLWVALGWYFLA
ncbi:MAG: phosphatidate cytidylyltransferase [Bacteroidia bacterium]|nr:phosphatidate cytidylyltransferase [Bacteroidia bacterium]